MFNFILLLVIYMGIFSILALGLNLVVGYTGMLSLCQAAFFAIGAYTTAVLSTKFGFNFWTTMIVAAFLSMSFGLLIGLPTLRLKGDYLAIATLGFGEIVKNIIINWDTMTNGPMGINGIPTAKLFSYEITPYFKPVFTLFVWFFVLITFLILSRIGKSRFGRALEAIREDEIAALAMGINISKYKVLAFSISAFFGGIAGSIWAVYNQSVAPETFNFMLSIMILCMVVIGGLGNNKASLLGAFIIVIVSELPRLLGFSSFIPAQTNQILFGAILVFMMVNKPSGIVGRKKPNFEKLMQKYLIKERSSL